MPILHRTVQALAVLGAGMVLGALSWAVPAGVSGAFEPYDSSLGLLVNQTLLGTSAVIVAWHGRLGMLWLGLIGAHLGLNAYAYGFGGSEHRAWAALGAWVSVLLLLLPLGLALVTFQWRRRAAPANGSSPPLR